VKPIDLRELFESRGQGHLFAHWQDRDTARKQRLLEDLRDLDLDQLDHQQCFLREPPAHRPELSSYPVDTRKKQQRQHEELRETGEMFLRSGKTACLTAAGGQGSRLGLKGPKGMFPISPIRGASLFQIFAEKILAAGRRFGVRPAWYIMTSPLNHEETIRCFRTQNYFGLNEEEVVFFSQEMFPSLTPEGKLILAEDGGLFKNPNGHGGLLSALYKQKILAHMREHGIEELFYFQVDNPLVHVPDPLFLGMHLHQGSQLSSKVIAKEYAEERLGTVGRINGRPGIIEYSDLDATHMYARDENGSLIFLYGSIAVHIFNVAFLDTNWNELPLHRALKKVNSFVPGAGGGRIETLEAVKFEMFIFDALIRAANPLFFETSRREEFAPLKNASGSDSIDTCARGLVEKHASWLERCGVRVPRNSRGESLYRIEISPLYAFDCDALKKRIGPTVNKIDEDTLLA
jgi:UDP-N-acetylglucosamine/UDP-N-acetylgalactosamine diphosphorylase